ncbi:hypothetical protein ZRA01_38140 [Zoogloea ramigera]|uniref:Uncharacterized protein n=1 Tax=Zoogloea ramigera TaxID=350 RepID=A0A4Y4CXW5_ZOORA|nr:hypothetical protein [Zoogloea ramigera]GEC97741.1 hypothetical protein ZRA01_38140 [Zoogloea ramigera]
MTTPSPSFADTYPPELRERIELLAGDEATPRDRRTLAIFEDDEVMRTARGYIARLLDEGEHWRGEDRLARLDAFFTFIDEAARTIEAQPPGSHLRYNTTEPLVFSTPGELQNDLAAASAHALKLTAIVERTATAVSAHFSISAAYQLIDLLDAFYEATATATANHVENRRLDKAAGRAGAPGLPGSKAGKSAMRNWLMGQIATLAAYHLRDRAVELVTEVTRALMNDAEPVAGSTAREIIPNTRLVPAEGAWALSEDWRDKIEQ